MSSPTDLYKLGKVNPGDNIRGVARADRIMALQNISKAHVNGEPYSQSSNLDRVIGPGWVIHRRRRIRTFPSGASLRTPFLVVSRVSGGELQLGVIHDSHLFNSEDRNTYEYPNDSWGLLDVDETTGWITVTTSDIGKKLWIEIELQEEDQAIVSVQLRYAFPGTGGAWTDFPDPIEIDEDDPDNPAQLFWHQIIAEISNPDIDPREGSMILTIPESSGTQIQVTQLLFDNLFMTTGHTTADADDAGLPLLVSVTPYGPATDTGGTGTPISPEDNLMTPWQLGDQETLNDYNFELFNASEPGAAKVLVLDGVVYGPNNDTGVDPDGMPSNDTYTIDDIADEDEIWLEIDWSADDPPIIETVSINHGPSTPDDTDDPTITYVTIGNVAVDDSGDVPIVTCRNEICGDVIIQLPPQPFTDNFVLFSKAGDLIWSEVCDAECGATAGGGDVDGGGA
jgi:hypothetical protein